MGVHSLKPDPDRAGTSATTDADALPSPRSRRTAVDRRVAPTPPPSGGSTSRARHAKARPAADSVPFHQNKRLFFAAVVVAALVLSVVGYAVWRGSGPGRPCTQDYVGKQSSDVCADERGTVAMDNLTVSATPLAATDNGTGGLTLCSDVTLSNNSGDKQDYNIQDFTIQNAAGQQDPPDPEAIAGTLRSGSLGLGGTKTGRICDDRPAQKGLYALIYAPSLFDSQRGIWLSQH